MFVSQIKGVAKGKIKSEIDSVIEKAAYIYRKALEKGLVRGRSISALIASALYAACRDTETPRTLKDVADAANVKRKDIARCYRLLHHELELKMPVVDSIQCIARISSKLEISEKTKRYAVKVLKDDANPVYLSLSIPTCSNTLGCTMPQPSTSSQPEWLQTRQPSPAHMTHCISTSAEGSVKGK